MKFLEIMNRLTRFTCCLFFLSLIWTPQAWALTEILNLRHWASPEHTRVVIDTAEEIKFTSEKSPSKVTLNLLNTTLSKSMSPEYILNQPGIVKIVLTPLAAGNVRIELIVAENVSTHVFKLKKFQDKPYRVVVDITLPEIEKEKSQAREQVKVVKKDKIIVIDPGHGGEDPGATGRRGTMEKEVVLAMGRKLRDLLNTGEGTRAFLTRDGDYYVPFKKRLSFARELGADLFISIHADASRNSSATGSSVYCLSTGGASSEAAKILARKENLADIIGGTLSSEEKGGDESNPIILSMFQTNTINRSKTFGGQILNTLCRVNDIKFSRVQEAPFRVLKLPEIPAILIETAYISNPLEELKLRDDKFQAAVARSITESVREFFSLPALPVPVPAKGDDSVRPVVKNQSPKKQPPAVTHTVKKGDTLTGIAARYNMPVGTLLKLNKIKPEGPLYVGRQLSLSVPEPERKSKIDKVKAEAPKKSPPLRTALRRYKVKKGDTIVKIARHHHVSVSALLKLNRMQLRDPLYVGRELSLPQS